jgi:mannose-6-phosphate isomerase-like protein (cupin superfamily)
MRRYGSLALLVIPALFAVGLSLTVEGLPRSSDPAFTQLLRHNLGNQDDSVSEILQRYAKAWRGQGEFRLPRETVLGFWVSGDRGGDFHITLTNNPVGKLAGGSPDRYDLGFEVNIDVLRRLDRGELNVLTALAQAHGNDPTPLVLRLPSGSQWTPENRAFLLPLLFHFWNREWPEVVRFGEGLTRQVHGANAAVLFYDRGFRSAWYQLKPGMHINADPQGQTNEYPQLIIVTRGRLQARLDGKERRLSEGEAVLIPPGMRHEFWAGENQSAESVFLAFGPGA